MVDVHEKVPDGERRVVEVREARAWIDGVDKLRIAVRAVVDSAEVEREFAFYRYNNVVEYGLWLRVGAQVGCEVVKRLLEVLSVVWFGRKPGTASGGERLNYTRRHLEYATRYKELKEEIEK